MPATATTPAYHATDPLTAEEMKIAAQTTRSHFNAPLRFNTISLVEPPPAQDIPRQASVLVYNLSTSTTYHLIIALQSAELLSATQLPVSSQPPLTPDDCFLAERIAKADGRVQKHAQKHGIHDVVQSLVCDPWSVHLADDYDILKERPSARLVQLFLYRRDSENDNHYAHPLPGVPVVDLHAGEVVSFEAEERVVDVPAQLVNYRADLLAGNSYLETATRKDAPRPLQIVQPEGPSFMVKGREVRWQKWSLRVAFTAREGVVLRDVCYDGRSVMRRAAVVEMAVPYAEPRPPFHRKCAFDVGDYGLGYCANSLQLGCDCLGTIHYFDAILNDSHGEPYTLEKAVCVHEEDAGLLYKHMEYRTGHAETRRARRLVISFVATVVNYEYLFYWYLHHDGSLALDIKLSGELSTNVLSEGETSPSHGVLVAPGVNAQIHQHMFCARLDVAVDGPENSVAEMEFVRAKTGRDNPYGNAFKIKTTALRTELGARRDAAAGRTWRVYNSSKINVISGKSVGYKLVPYASGAAQPALLTTDECAVSARGGFATKALWVTPFDENERFPAGEYPVQSKGGEGLAIWTQKDREVENRKIVVWHSFGVAHVPRTEDFPVMPCETTGFVFKPDCFFLGNPGIDLPGDGADPAVNGSTCCSF